MTFAEFTTLYNDEKQCKLFLKSYREKSGLSCRKCSCTDHYWKSDKEVWECRNCDYRMSLKAGTAMHGSKLPLKTWFTAYYFVLQTKKNFSSCEMQRLLGIRRYETVWYLIQRIRQQMSKHNSEQFFKSMFDFNPNYQVSVNTRRTRMSRKNDLTTFILPESYNSFKLKPKADSFLIIASKSLDSQDHQGKRYKLLINNYQNLFNLDAQVKTDLNLPSWVLNTQTNVKRVLDGTHHLTISGHTQLYLDEFSYKYNYRSKKINFNAELREFFSEVGAFADNHFRTIEIGTVKNYQPKKSPHPWRPLHHRNP